jgi:hypothetical protein
MARWATKGLPAHLAADARAAAGREAIAAGEGDPEVQPSTGRFDVEALYGDVGMADRPVLNPELFAAPRSMRRRRSASSANATRRRLRAGDEPRRGVRPHEHFDALKAYRGTVTAEAIGEALGLSRARCGGWSARCRRSTPIRRTC